MDGQLSNTPHPTPTQAEEDRLDWLRLIRSHRVGPITFHRLMAEHGSAGAALAALPDVAAAAGVQDYQICPRALAKAEIAKGQALGAKLIFRGDPYYPPLLAALPDAPPLLWVIGDLGVMQRPMVALVGARNASSLGLRMARSLGEGLGQAGLVVVSGLARGIDAAAHQAALGSGTVAVQAGGVDVVYPEENAALAAQIAGQGLRLSEQPIGLKPMHKHFPMRNRLISGLCRAVVVVEAAGQSGSLITAKAALDQGREVLAVPGHPFDARAWGCNMLIRDGAGLVRGVADILEVLGGNLPKPRAPQDTKPAPRPAMQEITRLHEMILSRLGPSPLAEDQLIRDLAVAPEKLATALLSLELEGQISRHSGGLLSRL